MHFSSDVDTSGVTSKKGGRTYGLLAAPAYKAHIRRA